MREIKFRAFCDIGEENKMLLFSEGKYDNGLWFEHTSNHIDQYLSPLMQYTGLKDKNGKEIYEGDIMSKVEIPDLGKTIDYFYVVKWSSSDFGYRTFRYRLDENENGTYWRKQPSSDSLNMVNCYNHVIGNIYENPELLNE